ncbi:zinc metallochaperone AztD [Streptomyces profundus]|uniref:zinc metallochaperone AztD n=1 Tax=Streptomyces profundus TaxID=2867410 RepID=UPI001D16761A|nr:zinc metallochaperone AztD [Streptomyces sp. MA3_2.13]UED87843.1 hypothetical protein K4G22_29600 [Streptomyces sp. MA3_2.13]
MHATHRLRGGATLAALTALALGLTACGSDDSDEPDDQSAPADSSSTTVEEPIVLTYDGGLQILDGRTLEVARDIPLDGFNRVNPAGDDHHVLVSTATGFRVLNATAAELTEDEFPGEKPGHVVRHAGSTVLFADGSGEVTVFDPEALGEGLPETDTHTTAAPHHGVAVALESGELLVTLGTEEERSGAAVLDRDREEVTRNEECPGVHGETVAEHETVLVGCENGALIYRDGAFVKVESPTAYGRIGNVAGSEESPVVLGDYKQDPDAELERPEQVSLIDTATGELELVDLGTSYTFRSLARGPHGEALVLGTDGRIHVIDPDTGEVTTDIPVLDAWEEPLEWQQPRPALFVRDHTAYVTDPEAREIHAIDIESGEVLATGALEQAPNEVSGAVGG